MHLTVKKFLLEMAYSVIMLDDNYGDPPNMWLMMSAVVNVGSDTGA